MVDAALIASELLKWTRPQTHQCVATVMDHAIKQGFPEDWCISIEEEINNWYPTIKLSWLGQLWPISMALPWNQRLAHGLNIIRNEHLVILIKSTG